MNLKRYSAPIVSALLGIMLLNACCHKVKCIETKEIFQLQFEGFLPDDLDTIYLKTYNDKDKLLVNSDTIITKNPVQNFNGTAFSFLLNTPFKSGFSYNINFNSNNSIQEYLVSEFAFKEDVCNECLLIADQKFITLSRYTLNGERKEFNYNPFIKISK